jgi:hypothetical protein
VWDLHRQNNRTGTDERSYLNTENASGKVKQRVRSTHLEAHEAAHLTADRLLSEEGLNQA